MRNLYLLLVILGLALQVAAQSVNVSGIVYDSANGNPVVNYPVDIVIYDSMTSNVVVQSQIFTDSSGQYAFSFPLSNFPSIGTGYVNVIDCNGAIQSLHFGFLNGSGSVNFVNFDFYLCTSTGTSGCNAFFSAGNGNGGLTISFTDLSVSTAGAIVSQNWNFGDSTFGSGSNPSHAYVSYGTYTVCLSILTSGGCVGNYCQTVLVDSVHTFCQADFYAIPDTTGQYTMLLVDNSTGSGLAYTWNFGDGSTSTQTYPQHTYAGPGTYNVCLTVADTNGNCISTFCDSIVVINKMATAFTIQVVPAAPTGIAQAATHLPLQVELYPNPAKDILHANVELGAPTQLNWQVLDLHGRAVLTGDAGHRPAGSQEWAIPAGQLVPGIYLLKIDGEAQLSGTHRFVVAR